MLALAVIAVIFFGIPTSKSEVTFKYTAFGGKNNADQLLEIHNDGLHSITTKLEITPLDAFGVPIEGLKVTSAFGTERGEHVLPSLYTEGDYLKFEGDRAHDVRNVRVKIKDIDQVRYPEQDKPFETQHLDKGRPVEFEHEFDAVKVSNPNGDAMRIRLVLIAWNKIKKGQPQDYEWAIPLESSVKVPAHGNTTVTLPEDLTGISYVTVEAVQVTS